MSPPKKSISISLAIGTQGEKLLQNVLEKANLPSILNPAKKMKEKREWDVQATFYNKDTVTFEVKYDLYAAKSGNIAIEFFNSKSGTPSGLTATTADIWCHVITNPMSIWLTSVTSLKKFCEENKPFKTITAGGDDNSCMYLYKQDFILDSIFHRIDDMEPVSIRELINILRSKNEIL